MLPGIHFVEEMVFGVEQDIPFCWGIYAWPGLDEMIFVLKFA